MECHCGRCYGHSYVDRCCVISFWLILCQIWQIEWPCYKIVYFNLNSRVFNRTSAHICGRWYFLVKGWIINVYVYSISYGSSEVLVIPFYYTEVVNCCSMTCGVTVVIYSRGGLDVLLEPLPKCS